MISPSKEMVKGWAEVILNIHDDIIKYSGGLEGVRDEGGLEHAIYVLLQYRLSNPNKIFQLAARAYQMFATRHYFNDGNKRTSHVFAKTLLFLSDYHFTPKYDDAVKFIIQIGTGNKTPEDIENWIKANTVKIDKSNVEAVTKEFALRYKELEDWKDERKD